MEETIKKIAGNLKNGNPLQKTFFIVNNTKLKQWLSQKIAKENNIFAGYEFLTFDGFLRMVSQKCFPDNKFADRDVLFWRTYRYLAETDNRNIKKYCGNILKRFQFAEHCNSLFSNYMHEDPEIFRSWIKGENKYETDTEKWQKEIYLKASEGLFTPLTAIEELKKKSEKIFIEPFFIVSDTRLSPFQEEIRSVAEKICNVKECFVASHNAKEINPDRISIISASNPQREVEILYDHILKKLDENENLKPRDILVLTPDMDKYAPYFESVFTDNDAKLRFTVSDNTKIKRSPLSDAFNEILNLNNTPFRSSDMEKIFSCRHVLKKFDLEEDDKKSLLEIIGDAGFKRYVDGTERSVFHHPGDKHNTFEFTKKRLLLGYSMKGEPDTIFNKISPFEDKEGGIFEKIGNLIELFSVIKEKMDQFREDRTFTDWREFLSMMVEDLFHEDHESVEELVFIRKNIDMLGEMAVGDDNFKVPFDSVRMFLNKKTNEKTGNSRFMRDGISFASLNDTGPLPFRLLCFAGMNDGSFPAIQNPAGLNLLELNENYSKREQDKKLFRNLISEAKECIITYTGYHSVKGRVVLPSSVVSDLHKEAEKYPIHPFSEELFLKDSPLFTYNKKAEQIFNSLQKNDKKQHKIISDIELSDKVKSITIEELITFFKNPPKAFFTKSAGIYVPDEKDKKDEHEMFAPNKLDEYKINDEILKYRLENLNMDALYKKLLQQGKIPAGVYGEVLFKNFCDDSKGITQKLKRKDTPKSILFKKKFTVSDIELEVSGELTNIYENLQILYRPAGEAKVKDKIEAGIRHLFFNYCVENNDDTLTTKFITLSPKDYELNFNENIEEKIIEILKLYAQGMGIPLIFMPDFSHKLIFSNNDPEETAIKSWSSDHNYDKDFYNDLVFIKSGILEWNEKAIEDAKNIAEKIFENTGVSS